MNNQENPQIIYSWVAPVRAYKKTKGGILRFYIAVSLLLSLIVYFFGEKILVLPIWAIMFLFYSLTITPPSYIENRITRFGVETDHTTYRWEYLSYFYFLKKFDYHVLVIVGKEPLNQHLYLIVDEKESISDLIKILSEHLIYQEKPKKNFVDKMTESLTKLMPDYKS